VNREQKERKHRVLTQSAASVTQSISDAIVIKNENLFFLSKDNGDVPLEDHHGFGLYYDDCRYLSGYELKLAGESPNALLANASRGFMAIFELTNPRIDTEDGAHADMHNLGISWKRAVDADDKALYEALYVENYGQQQVTLPLTLSFRCDFRDVFDIRGLLPLQPGDLSEPTWHDGILTFAYEGGDDLYRRLDVHFAPEPDGTEGTSARFQIDLGSREAIEIRLALMISEAEEKTRPARSEDASFEKKVDQDVNQKEGNWLQDETQMDSDSLVLNGIMDRSLRDLRALQSRIEGENYFAAGVPWFVTLFGRDSIITAIQTLAFDAQIAEETLRLLARYQAREEDEWRDAQPGKILHELRRGELANLKEIPHTPYYGSIDATPLFLVLMARYEAWAGNLDLFRELRENVDLAVEWLDRYGDLDGDGYVEYASKTDGGMVNQGWKDSGNGILNPDGSLPDSPIALVEVQAYTYLAKVELADLYERAGEARRAEKLRQQASELRERFNQDFWSEELGCYVLGLQDENEPIRTVSSNPGHALWAGIADADKTERTVERLMADDMFSGWGVRTVSSTYDCYNPVSYHLGTVWPHDNAILAAGFRRYGFDDPARRIFQGIAEAAMDFEDYRLPELFAGFGRQQYGVPVRYPAACHPQAWAAGTLPYLMETFLGLRPDGFEKCLHLVRPILPDFVDRLEVKRLRVGQARVDLCFERTRSDRCAVNVLNVEGELDVIIDTE
jgi:glycogen debranching enzyme